MTDRREYYESENFWANYRMDPSLLAAKIHTVMELIPPEVRSILDVGCGNGLITNHLKDSYRVVGADRSLMALRTVTTSKLCSNIDHIGVQDASFDLVFSSQVLEHLPDHVLVGAISGMRHVARRYIFITVPYEEDLKRNFVRCPVCGLQFNVSYHQQSFSLDRIRNLFPGYRLVKHQLGGKRIRRYHPLLLDIRHRYADRWYRIDERTHPMCPRCGYTDFPVFTYNLLAFLCDGINKMISRRHHHTIYALFEKVELYG